MKIAICTPHYADVHALFAKSLAKMMVRTVQAPIMFNGEVTVPQLELFFKSSSTLSTLRNELVKEAEDWGANYLLWADADHTFPDEALLRLLGLNLRVVGVNYPRRTFPTWPTATTLKNEILWTTEEMARNQEITEVGHMGLGFCLMDMTVLNDLRSVSESIWPLFAHETRPGKTQAVGEDIYFFNKLRAARIPIHLDHALSWSIGHVHPKLLTNEDALREREAYIKSRP